MGAVVAQGQSLPSSAKRKKDAQVVIRAFLSDSSDPNAVVKVTVEITADFPDGATDQVKRAVSENARSLGLKTSDWE